MHCPSQIVVIAVICWEHVTGALLVKRAVVDEWCFSIIAENKNLKCILALDEVCDDIDGSGTFKELVDMPVAYPGD